MPPAVILPLAGIVCSTFVLITVMQPHRSVERLGESNRFVVKLLADKQDTLPP